MPVTYELDSELAFIHTRCTGNVTFQEVIGHFAELERDESLPDRLDVLLDLDEMESLPERDQLHSVVGEMHRLESSVKWGAFAIVASRDALFGMSRMFEVFAEGRFTNSGVFREHEQARQWIESIRSRGA
jgi:hypothetical protein